MSDNGHLSQTLIDNAYDKVARQQATELEQLMVINHESSVRIIAAIRDEGTKTRRVMHEESQKLHDDILEHCGGGGLSGGNKAAIGGGFTAGVAAIILAVGQRLGITG